MVADVEPLVRGRVTVSEDRLETLYRRYAPMVHRRCLTILGDEAEALDALQDLFLQIRDKLDTFRDESKISTWLYRIATNHCLNRLRSARSRARLAQANDTEHQYDPRTRLERRDLLLHLIEQLEERDVQIAVHRHLDGMTQPEIAEVLGVSERTVRKRLSALNEKVAEAMKRLEEVRP